ncbi:hypothetical protein [Agromyces bauzanensis]
MTENTNDDALVEQFAAELDGLTVIDAGAFLAERDELLRRIVLGDDRDAVRAVLELPGKSSPQYALTLMREVAAMLGLFIVFDAETWQIPALRSRLGGVALAVRTFLPPSPQRGELDDDHLADAHERIGDGTGTGDGPDLNQAEQGGPDDGHTTMDGR